MLADHFDAALDAALTLPALDELSRVLWQAYGAGALDDAAAERLGERIELERARIRARAAARASGVIGRLVALAKRRRPRSPDRAASLARRRRLAASSALPPNMAEWFRPGEIAVLSVVGHEAIQGGLFDWPMDRIAAVAGVSRTTVRNALRSAQQLGLLVVRERRRRAARSDTNIITIASNEWAAWLHRGGGRKKVKPTTTEVDSKRCRKSAESREPARKPRSSPGRTIGWAAEAWLRVMSGGGAGKPVPPPP